MKKSIRSMFFFSLNVLHFGPVETKGNAHYEAKTAEKKKFNQFHNNIVTNQKEKSRAK